MIDMYYKYDANIFAAKYVPNELVHKYGILKYKNNETKEVERIIEKPTLEEAPSNFATIGRYIVKPEVFEEIKNIPITKGEYVLTNAFELMMNYQKFYSCEFSGEHYDTGSKIGYLEAVIAYSLDDSIYNEELTNFIKKKVKKM